MKERVMQHTLPTLIEPFGPLGRAATKATKIKTTAQGTINPETSLIMRLTFPWIVTCQIQIIDFCEYAPGKENGY